MAKGDICIIGMGRFGHSVLETLSQRGKNVVVIDEDRATITKNVNIPKVEKAFGIKKG